MSQNVLQKQKVLLVDDEKRNQKIVIEILEDLVDLKVCSSGEEAMEVVEQFDPDLVLLDIMMTGIDGYEVCRRIRANPKLVLTKVILVSGKAMIDERLQGYEVGGDSYMTKPFVPEELLAIAKVFLRLSYVERELSVLNKGLEEEVQRRTSQLLDAEGKLIASAKMSALGEMAGGIAHEINTPLGTIGLLADSLQERLTEPEVDVPALLKMTEMMASTVKRIGRIINGLRTFSRDGSNDVFTVTPFREVLETTLSLCGERLKQSGVELQIADFPEDLQIRCRQVQLSQVLLNLIGNSCDALDGKPAKWIRVGAEKTALGTRVIVTDSGHGVPLEVAKKIFQPFFTTKDVGKGTGLGLSISQGIMTAHGGSLSLDPACENTRFIIELPDEPSLAGKSQAA